MKHPKYPVAIVLLFVVLGPPLGAVTLTLIITGEMLWSASLPDAASMTIIALMYGLPMSYILGGIQALVLGIIAAFYVRERQTLSYHFMITLSLIAAALYTSNFYGMLLGLAHTDFVLTASLWLAHLVPTVVLTRMIRKQYRLRYDV
ncbi:hypothetical protein [Aliidiomarina indica]|uniref:hypothetical protein n=1 Tax=Aliidiomarina indica TaxID=2749147 RepID=UPI00188F0551|nr:hypothetical protein [Aliidiomarina indica]